jgi:chromate transporter
MAASNAKGAAADGRPVGSAGEVFRAFLKLGLTSFGGPIAHIGYFREEFVVRRRWLGDDGFGDLVAICQFLPGPASSQVGFSIGVLRGGGLLGGIAAWIAFTLPSAVLIVGLALGAASFGGPAGEGLLHGLKLVAVAVVAQAVFGMARTLAPDRPRAAIAFIAVALVALGGGAVAQVAGIAIGGLAGLRFCRDGAPPAAGHLAFPIARTAGGVALVLFAVLLLAPAAFGPDAPAPIRFFEAFYRSGALVFGGGHVVLPLLQQAVVPEWVGNADFLAGYGLAQAVPGPLFTFAAYLGFVATSKPGGIAGAAIALIAIFLPGLLLVYGVLPFWDLLRGRAAVQAAMRGANAAVVGILAAALYDPVWTGTVAGPRDFALALGGFLALTMWKVPPFAVVIGLAATGAALGIL